MPCASWPALVPHHAPHPTPCAFSARGGARVGVRVGRRGGLRGRSRGVSRGRRGRRGDGGGAGGAGKRSAVSATGRRRVGRASRRVGRGAARAGPGGGPVGRAGPARTSQRRPFALRRKRERPPAALPYPWGVTSRLPRIGVRMPPRCVPSPKGHAPYAIHQQNRAKQATPRDAPSRVPPTLPRAGRLRPPPHRRHPASPPTPAPRRTVSRRAVPAAFSHRLGAPRVRPGDPRPPGRRSRNARTGTGTGRSRPITNWCTRSRPSFA